MAQTSTSALQAGAAAVEITPADSQFLYGYPHVERISTGVHDPLYASALYVFDGKTAALFIANDIIWVPREITNRARRRIAEATGVAGNHVLISATHSHSAPIVGHMLIAEADPIVPRNDPAYLQRLEDAIVEAGTRAHAAARPAELGLACANATGIGTNRHDPEGPANLECPVLAARDAQSHEILGLMTVCNMHPTVLHEDSTLVSGDFPGLARQYVQHALVGEECPFVYHMGTAGNQSPRHVTHANTFEEAQRLGEILGKAVGDALDRITYHNNLSIQVARKTVELPLREMPSVEDAEARLKQAVDRLEQLRRDNAPRTDVRTAEVDWFGAEETVTLAKAQADGRIQSVAQSVMPAEVQMIRIGDWKFIGWPGEVFVEFGLDVQEQDADAFVITLANSDLQGYLVTQEAIDNGSYEAGNAIFKSPDSGERLVQATRELLAEQGSTQQTQA